MGRTMRVLLMELVRRRRGPPIGGPRLRRTSSMSKTRIVLPIEAMSCASCAATVQAALGDASGVSTATVNYATGKGAVDYDDAQTSVAELIKTVRAAGYDCGRAS